MFIKPRSINVTSFWSFHPHQPKTNIPFRPSKLYNRKNGGHRKWISYCVKKKALFCNICLCYGDGSGSFSVYIMIFVEYGNIKQIVHVNPHKYLSNFMKH